MPALDEGPAQRGFLSLRDAVTALSMLKRYIQYPHGLEGKLIGRNLLRTPADTTA